MRFKVGDWVKVRHVEPDYYYDINGSIISDIDNMEEPHMYFSDDMVDFVGNIYQITSVGRTTHGMDYVMFSDETFNFIEAWLQPVEVSVKSWRGKLK